MWVKLPQSKNGRLTRFAFEGIGNNRHSYWIYKCQCGNFISVCASELHGVHSCGCLRREVMSKLGKKTGGWNRTHGESHKTVEWSTWQGMKQRCYNMANPEYRYWSGRGIEVCNRWINSFENFLKDMGRRPKGMSIDRID